MKKELSQLMLIKLKAELSEMFTDFYMEMRKDIELEQEEYASHFQELGNILFQIDSCQSIDEMKKLHAAGELDLVGEDFAEFVTGVLIGMERSSK
jgi:hypothetical protein